MRAVISAGSNMEDSRAHLQSVADEFAAELLDASSIYATAPWGGVEQPDFLNQSFLIETDSDDPYSLLARCQRLEQQANRARDVRWGPRTLDVDIIDFEGYRSDDPELTLPHPRAHLREFVLVPWLEIDPHAKLLDRPVSEILAELEPQGVRKL